MGFEQYHEPAAELTDEARTYARIITSLIEEAEAIDWYQQRMSVENDAEAVAIMESAQEEEFKHFGMDLEFLLRRTPNAHVTIPRPQACPTSNVRQPRIDEREVGGRQRMPAQTPVTCLQRKELQLGAHKHEAVAGCQPQRIVGAVQRVWLPPLAVAGLPPGEALRAVSNAAIHGCRLSSAVV